MFSSIKEKLSDKETLRKAVDLINKEGFSKIDEIINNSIISQDMKETLVSIKELVDQLQSFDVNKIKYYSNEAFDGLYNEFLLVYNGVFKDGINLDSIKAKKEEFDRINHNKVLKFIKEIENLYTNGATKEEIKEVKKKLRLCYDSYLLANRRVKVNSKYSIPISKVDKKSLETIARKFIKAKKNAEITFNELSSKARDKKEIFFEKIESKKQEFQESLVPEKEIYKKIEELNRTKNPDLALEIKDDIRHNKKISKKIRTKTNIQKVCTVPQEIFSKIKNKLKSIKDKIKDVGLSAKEKLDQSLNNYYVHKQRDFNEKESSLRNEKREANDLLSQNSKKVPGSSFQSIETNGSMDDIAKAIEEALKMDEKLENQAKKTENKNKKKIRVIGRKQKLITFKKNLVQKLYDSYFKEQESPVKAM